MEGENFTSNHSLETDYYDSSTLGYSEDNSSQPVTESSNETDYDNSDADLLNWQNDIWALLDQQYLRHNLGWSIAIVVAYTLIYLVGLVGNCMVILVVIKRPKMRTVTNLFIMNLAVADLLLIICCVPTQLFVNLFKPWIFGSVVCKSVLYMEWVSISASAYSLAAISFDRCKAIHRPQSPPRGLSKRQALVTICLIWTLAMTLTVPLLINLNTVIVDRTPYCMGENKLFKNIYFLVVQLALFYSWPLILIFISNIIIWWTVSKRKAPNESASATSIDKMHRESRQSVGKMLGTVTLAFLLSWFPYYYIRTKAVIVESLNPWDIQLFPMVDLLAGSNSSLNPVLYAFMSKKFREMFKSLLPKWTPFIHRTEKKCESGATTSSSVINA